MCNVQCPKCEHFDSQSDPDVGLYGPAACNAAQDLADNGECSQAVANLFESLLFRLADLNNCPKFADRKDAERRQKWETLKASVYANTQPDKAAGNE